jgi:hypothetical protein
MNKTQKYFLLFLFNQSFIPFPKNIYVYNKHLEFLFTYDFRQHEKNLEMTLQ